MTLEELRAQLEGDLAWRQEELRHLRNTLLGDYVEQADWPAAALRALLVMQYAHIEGFTQASLTLYVDHINESGMTAAEVRKELVAAALGAEFRAFRSGNVGEDAAEDDGRLLRRAKRQVLLVERLRSFQSGSIKINAEDAVALEMNLGEEVLKKNFFMLAIPDDRFPDSTYRALEFVRRNRNDIAHGSRKERIEPGLFEAHWSKCWRYMEELVLLVSHAAREQWYALASSA